MEKQTLVYYHIPGDRDENGHPNVFAIKKAASEITLRDIKYSFPLPGRYHFRFKLKLNGTDVWLDVNNEISNIPAYGSSIVAKVLRISWLSNFNYVQGDKRGVLDKSTLGGTGQANTQLPAPQYSLEGKKANNQQQPTIFSPIFQSVAANMNAFSSISSSATKKNVSHDDLLNVSLSKASPSDWPSSGFADEKKDSVLFKQKSTPVGTSHNDMFFFDSAADNLLSSASRPDNASATSGKYSEDEGKDSEKGAHFLD